MLSFWTLQSLAKLQGCKKLRKSRKPTPLSRYPTTTRAVGQLTLRKPDGLKWGAMSWDALVQMLWCDRDGLKWGAMPWDELVQMLWCDRDGLKWVRWHGTRYRVNAVARPDGLKWGVVKRMSKWCCVVVMAPSQKCGRCPALKRSNIDFFKEAISFTVKALSRHKK